MFVQHARGSLARCLETAAFGNESMPNCEVGYSLRVESGVCAGLASLACACLVLRAVVRRQQLTRITKLVFGSSKPPAVYLVAFLMCGASTLSGRRLVL